MLKKILITLTLFQVINNNCSEQRPPLPESPMPESPIPAQINFEDSNDLVQRRTKVYERDAQRIGLASATVCALSIPFHMSGCTSIGACAFVTGGMLGCLTGILEVAKEPIRKIQEEHGLYPAYYDRIAKPKQD